MPVEENIYCLPCMSHYKTVFFTDLNFTQTLIRQTEHSVSEAAGKCHGAAGVGWSPGVWLGGRLLWSPGPSGLVVLGSQSVVVLPRSKAVPQPEGQASLCSLGLKAA